ncbi:hypothetical protein SAMN05421504_10194 [Amycolatopsis xylanica]|uniref:Uncharacterized protein n=1 Tax=Amycolatopsis xylanica TaxID=589385 RepID=A0A1H2S523_9PSEU|nr:hypothetical protein [Amycolatopsis xylanica]SDW26069.1 hypothetical protein SAMN05421504_10194 [Amycolatopsis xylanica]
MTFQQPPPRDEEILRVLQDRDGVPTTVVLRDGRALTVFDISWGYDMGDEFAHVTTNVELGDENTPLDVFVTNEVAKIVAPESGEVLLEVG